MGVTGTNGLPADLAAYRDLWRAAPADVAGRHGVALDEVAGAVCLGCASMSGVPILNHVFGVGLRASARSPSTRPRPGSRAAWSGGASPTPARG